MLRFLARFLAVVLAAVFVVFTVFAVFARPLGTQMLDPQTYKRVLLEKQLAERLPEVVAETIGKAAATAGKPGATVERSSDDVGSMMGDFSEADLKTLIAAALPADYVRAQSESLLDQFFSYVHSEATRPTVKLSMVDLKQRLSGGVVEDAYIRILQTKPPCSGTLQSLPTDCCPPAEQLPELRARFREMIGPAVRDMPDSVDLFDDRGSAHAETVYAKLAKVRDRVRVLAVVARWSWAVSVLLLVGVAVFAVRSLRGLLLWWGVPCLIAGGFAALFALPGAGAGDWFFQLVIAPSMPPDVPVLAVQTIVGLITALVQVVLGAALKVAVWLALGGLAAIVLAAVVGRRKPATPPSL
ncbi:MAG TPA: hypothetical protein VK178_12805 [Opitutaceae bacterium]|nr:hypothetical protein [Opitutaceae bacterium]